jgi:hypothetical protein
VRVLIAARPNLQPVGIGNNDSAYNVSLLIPNLDDADTASSAPDDTADPPSQLASLDSERESESEDDDVGAKRKRKENERASASCFRPGYPRHDRTC